MRAKAQRILIGRGKILYGILDALLQFIGTDASAEKLRLQQLVEFTKQLAARLALSYPQIDLLVQLLQSTTRDRPHMAVHHRQDLLRLISYYSCFQSISQESELGASMVVLHINLAS